MIHDPRFILDPSCPWGDLRLSTGTPDILWCEKQICSWVTNPVNAWTNIAYLILAIALYVLSRKEKSENLRFYWVAIAWIGGTSFIYHASLAFPTQILDFFGMYLFLFFLIAQNIARMGLISAHSVRMIAWASTFLATACAAVGSRLGMRLQPTVMLLIAVFLVSEGIAARKSAQKIHYRFFALSIAFLGLGAVFSAADVTRRICDPKSLFQGHALWHILGAVALFFSYLHARQFWAISKRNASR
jgi:hypothetical protein